MLVSKTYNPALILITMKFFHGPRRPVEDVLEKRIHRFLCVVNSKPVLCKRIMVFGITGPAGRGQAAYGKSDIDFYCILKHINPFVEYGLKKLFYKTIKKDDIAAELLVFAPSVLKKPDLMFFEFVTSGKVLLGRLPWTGTIEDIPKWEGVRLLCLKGDPFIANLDKKKEVLEIYFAKMVQGIGEALLVLDNKYVADNFERKKRVMKNRYAQALSNFILLYKEAFDFRYKNKSFSFEEKKLKKKGIQLLKQVWDLYLTVYFDADKKIALKKLKQVKPSSVLNQIANRFFFSFNYLRFPHLLPKKNVRFTLQEPFIREIFLIQRFLKHPNEADRRAIAESWITAPKFWYPK